MQRSQDISGVNTMSETDQLQAKKDFLENLKQMPFLDSFEEKDLNKFLTLSKLKQYEAGEFIIDEKFYDSWIYFLVSGTVRIVKQGKELRVLRRRGDIFGEMAIIDGSERSASAYAIAETVCLSIDVSYLDRLPDNEKSVFYSVLYKSFAEILAERLRLTTEELVEARKEIERLKGTVSE